MSHHLSPKPINQIFFFISCKNIISLDLSMYTQDWGIYRGLELSAFPQTFQNKSHILCMVAYASYMLHKQRSLVEDLDSCGSGQRQPHPFAGGQFRSAFWNFIPFRRMRSPENRAKSEWVWCGKKSQGDGRFQTFQCLRRHGRLGACLQAEIAELPSCSKTMAGNCKHCMIALPTLDMHLVHDCLLCSSLFQGDLAKKKIYPTLWCVE